MRAIIKRNVSGRSYRENREGRDYFFSKGSVGVITAKSTCYDVDTCITTDTYWLRMENYKIDNWICLELEELDIIDENANRKSTHINKHRATYK